MAFMLAMIDTTFLPAEFAEISAAVSAAGHKVRRYPNHAAFMAATGDHAQIGVLLCMGNTPVDDAALARLPRLRALLSAVTGTEAFDIDAATRRGIVVGNGQTPLNYIGMAESTILLMLAALYDFNGTQRTLRDGLPRPVPLRARVLSGLTVGLIGFGKVAQGVAARLQPWGITPLCTVHRHNPRAAELGVAPTPLEALLRRSDVVSLHCSLTPQTRHILNARTLALCKPGAILINTGRGALIDEAALPGALAPHGPLAGAALDTFETEPLPADSPLRALPNVILTPHMIGHTDDANRSLMAAARDSVLRVAAGEPPVFVKNPEVLARWRGDA